MAVLGLLVCSVRAQPPLDPAPAGTTIFRPAFTKGDTFAYQFAVTATDRRTGETPAASATFRLRQTGTLRLNVLDVDDDGIATLSAVIASMELRVEFAQDGEDPDVRQVAFVHRGDGPALPVPPTPDEDAAPVDKADTDVVSALAKALAGAVIRFEALPTGRVRRVTGLEPAEEAVGESQIGSLAMGPFATGSIARMLERLWLVDEPRTGPDEAAEAQWLARAPGSEWTTADMRIIAGDNIAGITRTFVFEADQAAAAGKTVRFRAKGMLPGRRGDPDPAVPVISLKECTEEGSLVWNPAASRILSRREKTMTEVVATLASRSSRARFEFEIEISSAPASPAAPVE